MRSPLLLLLIAVATTLNVQADLPADATQLKQAYLEARAKALKPLDERYLVELKKLLDSHTRAGDLDGAVAIKEEITRLEATSLPQAAAATASTSAPTAPAAAAAESGKSGTAKKLHRDLAGTTWHTNWYDMTFTLAPEGTIAFSSPRAGTGWRWRVSEDGKLLVSQQGDPGFRDTKLNAQNDRFVIPYGDVNAKVCTRKP